jgi:hypothetical protein
MSTFKRAVSLLSLPKMNSQEDTQFTWCSCTYPLIAVVMMYKVASTMKILLDQQAILSTRQDT